MGSASRDKSTATAVASRTLLSHSELETLYLSGLPRRYVDAIPDVMLRKLVTIKLGGDETPETLDLIKNFDTYLKVVGFHQALSDVVRLQRLYGGAGLLMLINDGKSPEEPVDYNNIASIRSFVPLSRHELIPDDFTLIDYSKPTHYRISTSKKLEEDQKDLTNNMLIHHTRVARFDGLYLPWEMRSRNQGWGQSVIQLVWDAYKRYESSLSGLENLMSDSDLIIHKIPGLFQRLAAGGESDITKRLEANVLARSVYRGMVIDKEEEVDSLVRNLANIGTAMEPFVRDLQAATGWPASVLMGDSPGGLGKEGRFEERVWASLVEEWQDCYCRTPITELFEVIMLAQDGPSSGQPPESWSVHFPSVFTETDKERTELRAEQAAVDQIYLTAGVLNPLEVRESRFGRSEYSIETTLNEAVTERLTAQQDMQFEQQLMGMESQRIQVEQMANPQPPEGGQQAQPAQQQPASKSKNNQKKTDSNEEPVLIDLDPYVVQVTQTIDEVHKYGQLLQPIGNRLDTVSGGVGVLLGPSSRKQSKIYRLVFDADGMALDGPFVLGYLQPALALQTAEKLFPRQTVKGLRQLSLQEHVAYFPAI